MTTHSDRVAGLVERIADVNAHLFNERGPANRVGDEAALARGRAAFTRRNGHLLDESPEVLRDLLARQQRKLDVQRERQRAQAAGEPVGGTAAAIRDAVFEVVVPGGVRAVMATGEVTMTDPTVPFDVVVAVGSVGGEVDVTEVTFRRRASGRHLGARAIQEIPTGRFIEWAVRALTFQDGRPGLASASASVAVRRAMSKARAPRATGQAGQQPLSDDDLRFIAAAYRSAPPRVKRAGVEYAIRMHRPELDARTWSDTPSAPVNRYNYRVRAAKRRIDPETGRPFLP